MSDLTTYVNANIGDVDTRPATVLREAILGPLATQLVTAYSNLDTIAANQSITSPDAISVNAMDALAANFGLSRFAGTPASGSVRFYRYNQPLSTAPVTIPYGTVVSTANLSDTLQFSTLATVYITPTSTMDPVSGYYFVDVPAISLVSGTAGNVASNTITFTNLTNVDGVTNPVQFSGGQDTQTNDELAQLIIARAQGNAGTAGGYENTVRTNFSILDMSIITPTDPESYRSQFGGSTDIVVLSTDIVSAQETFDWTTSDFYPSFLPLSSVTSIIFTNLSGTVTTLSSPADYDVVLDTYSAFSGSAKEKSHVRIHPTFTPTANGVYTIVYNNSEFVRIIQSYLDDASVEIIGSDVLVKAAAKIVANAVANITIIPGYDATTVQASATTAATDYINAKLLGKSLDASDVVAVISDTVGVDSVDISGGPNTFQMFNAAAPLVDVQEIVANKQEYIRAGTITVNVVG